MDSQEQLSVSAARLRLGDREVLQGVDLSLPRGQVLALLGASGCGKTTLLRAIAGLQALDEGRVLLQGRDVSRLDARERGVGMVFQHYALFPNLSVRENIRFGPLARGASAQAASERADRLLDLIELQAHAGKLPQALSGGQRQRVALARALANEPSLLLMDEPFSALDENFRLPLRRNFRRLQQQLGQSCVIVTHDREEAFELADQVAVMFDGRIAQCASPMTLWHAPASRRVADFLGVFNRLEARRLPAPWQREQGSWIAPIAALQRGAGDGAGLRLQAQVTALYVGQQRVSVELRTDGDEALTLWCGHDETLPEPGSRLALSIAAQALREVGD